jgi:hypothetical protein
VKLRDLVSLFYTEKLRNLVFLISQFLSQINLLLMRMDVEEQYLIIK